MLKYCLKTLFFFPIIFLGSMVSALNVEQCQVITKIDISNVEHVYIDQQVKLYNNSEHYVVDKLSFNFPFEIKDIKTAVGDKNVLNLYDQNVLELDLFQHFIKPLSEQTLAISYEALGLISTKGGFTNIYLPKFDYCDKQESSFEMKLPIPASELKYISTDDYEISEAGLITFNEDADIYASWGTLGKLKLNVTWQLDNGFYVPVPAAKYAKLSLSEVAEGVRFFKDERANEFFNMENGINYKGGYEAIINPKGPLDLEYEGTLGFNDDIAGFNLPEGAGMKLIYQSVLDKLAPVLRRSPSSLLPMQEMMELTEQDSLQYAYILARLAEDNGFKANIYYGLLSLPISEDLLWHFWVGVKNEETEAMSLYDPFIEDLLGYRSYQMVTPHRYIWGTFHSGIDFLPEAFANIKNQSDMALFIEEPASDVLGSSFIVNVLLHKPQDLSKRMELVITNSGSDIIYISKVLFNESYDVTGNYEGVGILPNTAKVLFFNSELPNDMLFKKAGEVNALVELSNDGSLYSLTSNKVQVNAYLLYIAFFVSLYLFIVGSIVVLQKNYKKLNILFPSPKGEVN